eukprot:CAMPEP_0114359240 /NCGR_PEP_ID=MMETSP0101-20121206/22862_1 /TAXON_ID=38822 ORGANISM="Pteridomonas danica, Strain PT" /NCGR_SAMPLE_ID=MMETSP0101 /ASSEMBLY_ACC=CAM_ASM_000211 /LENGTH=337 /DNA_ID=CAMNT_0001502671 /DNA_START=134 /DNA_END=1144 /DNA_ORIENTATION=+
MRDRYGIYPGELIEAVAAPLVYRSLLANGISNEEAQYSLAERVGVIRNDNASLQTILTALDDRWERCSERQQFGDHSKYEKYISETFEKDEFQTYDSRVSLITSFFEKDSLLEAVYALRYVSKLGIMPSMIRDQFEGTLLHHIASESGGRLLIDLLPCSNLLTIKQREGFSPLHHACPDVIRFLVKHNIDVNIKTQSGLTPLSVVDTASSALCLLKLGASPHIINSYKHNALHLATSHGLWDVVYFLLRAGTDANQQGYDRLNPLALCKALQTLQNTSNSSNSSKNEYELNKVQKMLELWDESMEVMKGDVSSGGDPSSAQLQQQQSKLFFEKRWNW